MRTVMKNRGLYCSDLVVIVVVVVVVVVEKIIRINNIRVPIHTL